MSKLLTLIKQISSNKEARQKHPTHVLECELWGRIKGYTADDIRSELNRLVKAGQLEQGRCINYNTYKAK